MPSGNLKRYAALFLFLCILAVLLFFNISRNPDTLRLAGRKTDSLNTLIASDTTHTLFQARRDEALRLARSINDSLRIAQTWMACGIFFYNKELYDSAAAYHTAAMLVARNNQLHEAEVKATHRLAETRFTQGADSITENLYKQVLEKSKRWNDSVLIASCAEQLGVFYLVVNAFDKANTLFDFQLQYLHQDTAYFAIGAYYNHKGYIYQKESDYVKSIQYFQNSLNAIRKTNDSAAIVSAHLNFAITCKDLGFYELAGIHLLAIIPYYENNRMETELASSYNTLAKTNMEIREYGKALELHRKAMTLRRKIKNISGEAGSLNNIGETYIFLHQYDSAMYYLQQSLALKKTNKLGSSSTLNLLGEVYTKRNQTDSARRYFQESLESQAKHTDKKERAVSLNNLGLLETKAGNHTRAISYLNEARLLCHSIGANKTLLQNYELTGNLYRAVSKWKEALLFHDSLLLLKDSLLRKETNYAVAEMEIKYETEKAAKEIALLSEQNKVQQITVSQKNTAIYALAAVITLVVVIAGFIVFAYRANKKSLRQSNEIIHQKQLALEHKQHMLAELHHRIKNNLQVLATLLSLQQKRLTDETSREALRAVETRLDAMLLVHTGLYGESADGSIHIREYLQKLISNLTASFGYSPGSIRINLLAEDLRLDADAALSIGFVANEIVCNSLKHAFAGCADPEIRVRAWQEDNRFRFIFSDNGSGIPQHTDAQRDDSFGLKLIRLLVQQMTGTIEMQPGNPGTQYEITIPASTINT